MCAPYSKVLGFNILPLTFLVFLYSYKMHVNALKDLHEVSSAHIKEPHVVSSAHINEPHHLRDSSSSGKFISSATPTEAFSLKTMELRPSFSAEEGLYPVFSETSALKSGYVTYKPTALSVPLKTDNSFLELSSEAIHISSSALEQHRTSEIFAGNSFFSLPDVYYITRSHHSPHFTLSLPTSPVSSEYKTAFASVTSVYDEVENSNDNINSFKGFTVAPMATFSTLSGRSIELGKYSNALVLTHSSEPLPLQGRNGTVFAKARDELVYLKAASVSSIHGSSPLLAVPHSDGFVNVIHKFTDTTDQKGKDNELVKDMPHSSHLSNFTEIKPVSGISTDNYLSQRQNLHTSWILGSTYSLVNYTPSKLYSVASATETYTENINDHKENSAHAHSISIARMIFLAAAGPQQLLGDQPVDNHGGLRFLIPRYQSTVVMDNDSSDPKCPIYLPETVSHTFVVKFLALKNTSVQVDLPKTFEVLLRKALNDTRCRSVVGMSFIYEKPFIFTWTNASVCNHSCPEGEIHQIYKKMVSEEGIRDSFSSAFLPDFEIVDIAVKNMGICSPAKMKTLHIATIVVSSLVVIVFILCLLFRQNSSRRKYRHDSFLKERPPLIFIDEVKNAAFKVKQLDAQVSGYLSHHNNHYHENMAVKLKQLDAQMNKHRNNHFNENIGVKVVQKPSNFAEETSRQISDIPVHLNNGIPQLSSSQLDAQVNGYNNHHHGHMAMKLRQFNAQMNKHLSDHNHFKEKIGLKVLQRPSSFTEEISEQISDIPVCYNNGIQQLSTSHMCSTPKNV